MKVTEPSNMEAIMGHKRDFPKVVINVGGVKHEVMMMMTRQLNIMCP